MARLIRTEKEVEGRYEDVWIVVDEDALDQWPEGPLTTVGREVPRVDGLDRARGQVQYTADLQLVVEDVVTTGGSTRETMQVAAASGARVVGAASIVDRSGGRTRLEVPFEALLDIDVPTYQPDQCPLCAKGLPITKPGSRPIVS